MYLSVFNRIESNSIHITMHILQLGIFSLEFHLIDIYLIDLFFILHFFFYFVLFCFAGAAAVGAVKKITSTFTIKLHNIATSFRFKSRREKKKNQDNEATLL